MTGTRNDAVEQACRQLVQVLAVEYDLRLSNRVRAETPARMAAAFHELCIGASAVLEDTLGTVFTEEHDELVLIGGIPFASLCEHHLLPFTGHAAVGYVPQGGKVVGLSKLVRLVRAAAARPGLQERLTGAIANTLESAVGASGVMVVVEAEHTCMTVRGVQAPGTRTTTSAVRGTFKESAAARAEFLALIGRQA